ncbi:calcium-binding protein [Vibrio sp. STUT-A11]|nr:calcium-binding protein [Vibrio sp. STUT-A11]
MGNIVVIGLDGNVRTLAEGESPKPGELIIEEISDTSELVVEQVTPQGSSINVTDDITDLIEAIAQGQDPTQLGEEFDTAAGEANGSSPQTTGAINRTGAETLASTNFETVGISGTGFSSTQLQTLFDIFQPQTPEPTDTPTPAKVVAQDISSPTVNEGEQVTFEVTLDQPTEEITNIELSLDDGSAVGGSAGEEGTDYVNSTVLVTLSDGTTQEVEVNDDGTFTISLPIGEQSFTVSLDTLSNDVYEGPETFTLTGTTENQSTPVSGVATVLDDRPIVSISDVGNVDEGSTATFTVTLSNASKDTVQVQLALNPGDTEADDLGTLEYNTGSGWVSVPEDGIVTVPAGMTEFDVRVETTPDDVYEGPEDFSVTVTGLDAVQGEDTGQATIVDDGTLTDDDRPTVSIEGGGIVDEGNVAEFTVTLSHESEDDVQVKLTLEHVDTEADDLGNLEYLDVADNSWKVVPNDGVVTVGAGETEIALRIQTEPDEVYEGPEAFSVSVTGLDPVQGEDAATATIVDDGTLTDDDRPTVSIEGGGIVDEGNVAEFTVTLSHESEDDVQVKLTLEHVDTEADDLGNLEYLDVQDNSWKVVPPDGVVTIYANQTDLALRIQTEPDEVYEGPEEFSVSVEGIEPVQGDDSAATTIVDDGTLIDDDRPTVSIEGDDLVDEGNIAEFTVTLSHKSDVDVQVKLQLNHVDTEADDLGNLEYLDVQDNSWKVVPPDGVVTIYANQTDLALRIQTEPDEVYEGPEAFSVSVTGLDPVQGEDAATATIVDDGTLTDDDRPTVSIEGGGIVDEGNVAEFTVTLSHESEDDVQVKLTLEHIDTEADDLGNLEYLDVADNSWKVVPPDGVVTIYANQTDLALRIQTEPDEVYEGPEAFSVSVTGLDPVQGEDAATATIVDDGTLTDDDRPTVSIEGGGIVDEGNVAEFTVTLSHESEDDVQVKLTLEHIDTEADDLGNLEYLDVQDNSWKVVPPDGVVTIYANQTDLALRIQTEPDEVYEGPEEFSVSVEGIEPVQGDDSAATTIVDDGTLIDDDRPTVSIEGDDLVDEGNIAEFTVTLSHKSDVDVQVKLQLNHVDTEADDLGNLEYLDVQDNSWKVIPPDGVVTIYANQTDLALRIQTEPDEVYEGPEEFSVSVEGIEPVQGDDSAATTIVDDGTLIDDDRPTVSIEGDDLVDEGNIAEFTVTLSHKSDVDVQVKLQLNHVDTEADDLGNLEYLDVQDNSWKVVPPDGVVTIYANQTDLALRIQTEPDEVYEGPEEFSVSVEGIEPVQGDDSAATTIVDDDTPPSISNIINAVVSEEGLSFANPDNKPNTVPATDTTNSASFTGSFTVADPDTADVSVVLSAPSTLTSGGEVVSWVWDNSTQTLTGSTGPEASDVVATVVLTEPSNSGQGTWDYTVTLHKPLDHPQNDQEDIISFDLGISVSDGQTTTTESLNIVIEDDSPYAEAVVENVNATQTNGTNVQLVLDVSGSMNRDSVTGSYNNVETSRLDVLKSAAIALLLEYQLLGETKVQITLFDSNANILTENGILSADNSLPNDLASIWMDIDQAIALINGLTADGNTDYDDAVRLAGDDAIWGNAEVIENANNVSYFLSDGAPNPSTGQINSVEQGEWESQLEKHDVTALAYGVGTGTSTEYLEPVAYDATREVGKQIDPVVVEDISTLPAVLIQSIVAPITGVLGTDAVGASSSLFGADGGYVASVNYGGSTGITVTFDGTTITVDDSSNSTGVTTIVDNVENRVTFVMDEKNSLVLDLNTGEYTFFASSITTETQFDFDYVLTDLDGDKVAETVTFELEPNSVQAIDDIASTPEGTPVLVDVLSNDTSGGNGETLMLADAVVDPSQGQVLIVDNQIVFVPSNNLDDGDSVRISYRTESSNGDFDIGALNVSITASTGNATGVGSDSDDVLVGTANADILLGGAGDDTLSGDAGDDIIVGGLGSDILTGGADSDVFVWTQMETAVDEVTDFNAAEGDKLEFRDLFDDMSGSDISTLLDDFESGDYNGQVDDVTLSVTELNGNSTLTINKGGQQLEVNFDGASAADIANSLISNLEQFRE